MLRSSRTLSSLIAFLGCIVMVSFLPCALATLVMSSLELSSCLNNRTEECILPANFTLPLSAPITITGSSPNPGIIRGSGNSILDLTYNTRLLTNNADINVTLVDLEVRNGKAGTDPLASSSVPNTLNLIRVILRNMYASSGAGILGNSGSTIITFYLSNVNFINCTTGSSGASGIYIKHSTNSYLEDLTFSNSYASTFIQIESSVAHTKVTFGGTISMNNNGSYATQGALNLVTSGTFNISVLSSQSNPSKWYIQDLAQTGITVVATSGYVTFDAFSLNYSTQANPSTPIYAISTSGSGETVAKLKFETDVQVEGAGLLSAGSIQSSSITVHGQVLVKNCPRGPVITNTGPLSLVTSSQVTIDNYTQSALLFTSRASWSANGDITISRSQSTASSTAAISVESNAQVLIIGGGKFEVSQHYRMSGGYGGAIFVDRTASLNLRGSDLAFYNNQAFYGGGAYTNGSLILTATYSITFEHNFAESNGGALASSSSGYLSLTSESNSYGIFFKENAALLAGGALDIPTDQMSQFFKANFISNHAQSGCVVHFVNDECPSYDSSIGIYQTNTQTVTNTSCQVLDDLCRTSTPSCSGAAPSVGSWVCVAGQWTSDGSVTGGTVNIGSGTSVVVVGNLTISGDIIFGGTASSITLIGGCATISGSLQIELTPQELEDIAKQSGSTRTLNLISQNSSCGSLSSLNVNSAKSAKSCRKIESTTTQDETNNDKTSLLVIFKVNSFGCNVKWIILGCVLGGVLLIIVIIALVVTFNPRAKAFVRPFWARGKAGGEALD